MDTTATMVLVIALFIIMIGMGLSLTVDDFKRVLKYPKAVFVGFLNQIVLLPIIGFLMVKGFNAELSVAMGIMILAACPGGPTSNLVTLLARGDIALSVTLTAVNSVITIITIPLIVTFALATFADQGGAQIDAPIGTIAGSLVVVIAIPLTIGMSIKRFASRFAVKMEKPVRIASALVLLLVIIGLLIKERDNLARYFELALVISVALNVTTMTIGYLTARIARLNFKQALSICIESGNQNGTLAIHVAVVSLAMGEFAIVAAVYSLMMYVTALVPIAAGNRWAAGESRGATPL